MSGHGEIEVKTIGSEIVKKLRGQGIERSINTTEIPFLMCQTGKTTKVWQYMDAAGKAQGKQVPGEEKTVPTTFVGGGWGVGGSVPLQIHMRLHVDSATPSLERFPTDTLEKSKQISSY